MNDAQLRAALDALNDQLQDLGTRNDRVTNRNDQLLQQNQTNAVELTDARRRIEHLEAALRDGGIPVHGGGGPAQAAAAGGNVAAVAGPPRNPRMPTIHFEGKDADDWISFRQAFINASLFNNYSNQQAKWALKGCMRGAAFLSIQGLDHEDPNVTFDELLDQYEVKFMPPAASDIARARFETAVQDSKEGILQWHGRLQMLFVRAYGNAGQVMGEAMLIRSFARGLRHKRVREHVLRSQPQTYDEALNHAQTEQAVLDSSTYIPGSAPAFATNIGGQHQGGANRHARGEPMEIGAMGTGRIQCHSCHLFGHIARDCDKKAAGGAAAGGARQRPRPPPAGAKGGASPRKGETGKGEPGKKQMRRRFINAIAEAVDEYYDVDKEADDDDYPEDDEEDADEDGEEKAEASDESTKDFCE